MTLNFNPNNETGGSIFLRTIRRKNEITLWQGHRRNQGIERPQDAGKLTGLSQINQGFGAGSHSLCHSIKISNPDRPGKSHESAAAHSMPVENLNYNINPNLKAGITVNTDFAEAEVDDRQVKPYPFSHSFTGEKRLFPSGGQCLPVWPIQ